jgi:hypothetical protein
MPFVKASGIMRKLYHSGGCASTLYAMGCRCGVDFEINRLAHEMDEALKKFGTP